VEAHLEGATEVLIIPHKELFEVPWAALFDSQTGQYLIQRCVLRVAPSLRVARTAADALRDISPEEQGHALVVGNPLPTREALLCGAEEEAEFVAELLSGVGFEVHALMGQAATKADVQSKIEGAKWAHLACHGNFDHHSKGPHILLADLSLLPGTFFILYSGFPR
jgi:CHAT domain-containing protein